MSEWKIMLFRDIKGILGKCEQLEVFCFDTQSHLYIGIVDCCVIFHHTLLFRSPRYGISLIEDNMEPPMLSSYTRQYSQPYPNRCKPFVQKTETPDPIFNRRPKNDFEFTTGLDFKFLDDHMHNLSESRKKVNFFRQLR